MQKSAQRPYDRLIGREKSEVVNDEIVELRKFASPDDPMEVVEKANVEPEVLDRQMRVSRNVEEHELEYCPSVTATTWQQNEGVVVTNNSRGSRDCSTPDC